MLFRILLGCSFLLATAWAMPVVALRRGYPERTSVNGPGEKDGGVETRNAPDLGSSLRDRAATERAPKGIPLSNGGNKILEQDIDPSGSTRAKDVEKQSLSFAELEARNGNRYNPLIDRRDYTDPAKRYTFEELEAANANRYNRLIDVQGLQ